MTAVAQALSNRVLLVDDDYTDQRLVQIIMQRRGIHVDECLTPTAAPILIDKNGYDAIFVDYRLPILTGPELIKRFRDKMHCPVYILSAHDPDYVKEQVDKIGVHVDGIISKDGMRRNLDAVMDRIYGPL